MKIITSKTTIYFDSMATNALVPPELRRAIATQKSTGIVTLSEASEGHNVFTFYCNWLHGTFSVNDDKVNICSMQDLHDHIRSGDPRVKNLMEDFRLDLIRHDGVRTVLALFSDADSSVASICGSFKCLVDAATITNNIAGYAETIINFEYVRGENGLFISSSLKNKVGAQVVEALDNSYVRSKYHMRTGMVAFECPETGGISLATVCGDTPEESSLEFTVANHNAVCEIVSVEQMCSHLSPSDKVTLIKELDDVPDKVDFLCEVAILLRDSLCV